MIERAGRNAPCPCGSGKKYKKCCLDRELREEEDSIECVDCGRKIKQGAMSSFALLGDGSKEDVYFCSICYRDMVCNYCGQKLGISKFRITKCPDCKEVVIECRKCAIKGMSFWERIKEQGFKKRSRGLIKAAMIEEAILNSR